MYISKKNVRVGFTLIELLVVISIIALLLSIIMPALSKVKSTALITICKNNLKQLGLGFSMYAGATGKLPDIYTIGDKPQYVDLSPTQATWYFYVLRPKYDASKGLRYRGFGKLWEDDYLKDPKIYYCPGLKNVSKMNFHSFHNPTDPTSGVDVLAPYVATDGVITINVAGENNLSAFYSYSPLQNKPIRDASGTIVKWPIAKKSAELGSRSVLSCDRVGFFDYYTHKTKKGGNTAVLNMLYGDGHVENYANSEILNDQSGGSSGRMEWFFKLLDDAR